MKALLSSLAKDAPDPRPCPANHTSPKLWSLRGPVSQRHPYGTRRLILSSRPRDSVTFGTGVHAYAPGGHQYGCGWFVRAADGIAICSCERRVLQDGRNLSKALLRKMLKEVPSWRARRQLGGGKGTTLEPSHDTYFKKASSRPKLIHNLVSGGWAGTQVDGTILKQGSVIVRTSARFICYRTDLSKEDSRAVNSPSTNASLIMCTSQQNTESKGLCSNPRNPLPSLI